MILGVTPARGGSKGILRKNIRMICGEPLIAWTIKAARQSKLLDRYVVSTEDEEIAKISRKYGVRLLSPPELAADEASTISVLQDILKRIEADIVVVLQAISPIRNPDLIDDYVRRFLDTGADSLASGLSANIRSMAPLGFVDKTSKASFMMMKVYCIIKAELIRNRDRFGKKIERVITAREQNIEIDGEFDFWIAEQVLKGRGAK